MARSFIKIAESFLPSRRQVSPRPTASAEQNPHIQAIWDAVSGIPRGQVSTYGEVARTAGLPGRARLTGFALRMAPKDLNLPWHRVLGAGGRIVFPTASREYREQARRLRADGVVVRNGRVDRAHLVASSDTL